MSNCDINFIAPSEFVVRVDAGEPSILGDATIARRLDGSGYNAYFCGYPIYSSTELEPIIKLVTLNHARDTLAGRLVALESQLKSDKISVEEQEALNISLSTITKQLHGVLSARGEILHSPSITIVDHAGNPV